MSSREPSALSETTRGGTTSAGEAEGAGALVLTIVAHPEARRAGERAVLGGARTWEVSRTTPLFAHRGESAGAPLAEDRVSRRPLHVFSLPGGGARISLAGTGTVVTRRGEPMPAEVELSAEELARGVVFELGNRIALLLHTTTVTGALLGGAAPDPEIGGDSDAIRRVLWEVERVADVALPVLLRGETGSGKELVARAIHQRSPRRDAPFVAVNLGALTPSLAIAELFGAEKGAFTGSVRRQVGYFEQARGGTLFLDEVGEAPIELQVALLRALETGELQTVGAQERRTVDVRVVAATDADLEAKVASGSFRAPLLNRLGAYEIRIPPLRERRDDVGRLVVRFLREELGRVGEADRLDSKERPWLPAQVVARLVDHDWPGNVRQLRNVVRQIVIANRGRDRAELSPALAATLAPPGGESRGGASEGPAGLNTIPASPRAPDPASLGPATSPSAKAPVEEGSRTRRRPLDVTEEELGEAMRACRFDLAAVAQRLRVSRASMYLLLERYPQFRRGGELSEEELLRAHHEHGGRLSAMAEALQVSERALARRLRELSIDYEPSRS